MTLNFLDRMAFLHRKDTLIDTLGISNKTPLSKLLGAFTLLAARVTRIVLIMGRKTETRSVKIRNTTEASDNYSTLCLAISSVKICFLNNSFRNAIRLCQTCCTQTRPDVGPNCLQRLSLDNPSNQRDNAI